ncbi:MAG: methyltransferase domain-containing protein [Chitinispirillaceae bacterium]|nr:methyltransferase domain-containing protein [Chitinispirillaceae bacterium]
MGGDRGMAKTEAFEKFSGAYDRWFERNRAIYEAELAAVRRLIPSPAGRGLEVGVGTGKFAAPLGIAIGVEPSGKMAGEAVRLGIHVCKGVAEHLPFPGSRFDLVLMVTTICFVDDILASFREAFRVLKRDGCFIAGFVDKESDLGKQYAERRNTSKFYKDAVFFSAREVAGYLKKAGFSNLTGSQALVPGQPPDVVSDGIGRGAFAAVRGVKQGQP